MADALTYNLPEDAEASILGCILVYPETKEIFSQCNIVESDFKSKAYGIIYSAVMELGDEISSVVVKEAVKPKGVTIPDGFFKGLMDIAINPNNAEIYAKLLKREAMKRKLYSLSEQLKDDLDTNDDVIQIISDTEQRLQRIESGAILSDLSSPQDACESFVNMRKSIESGTGIIPTFFPPLDYILGGGMLRSCLYILAARPGMGKTTLGLQIADNIAKNCGNTLFVSLEMPMEQIQGKRISRVSGIPFDQFMKNELSDKEYSLIVKSLTYFEKIPLYFLPKSSSTVSNIKHVARRIKSLNCIVIDYLQKLAPNNPKASRYEGVTEISGDLKALALELQIPIIALAQLNRENTARTDKRPQLSDLRDSGSIEQDADGVIMIHREDYYEMSEKKLRRDEYVPIEILVRKNRLSGPCMCTSAFYPAIGKIVEMKN